MILPVRLSDNEIKLRGEKLADLLREIGVLDEEKKLESKKYSDKIKEKEIEANEVADAIRSGQEDRDVEIERRPDYTKEVVEVIRLDTGEIIASEPMTDEDRQLNLTPLN